MAEQSKQAQTDTGSIPVEIIVSPMETNIHKPCGNQPTLFCYFLCVIRCDAISGAALNSVPVIGGI